MVWVYQEKHAEVGGGRRESWRKSREELPGWSEGRREVSWSERSRMQGGVGQRDTAANKNIMNASFLCNKARSPVVSHAGKHESSFCPDCISRNAGGTGSMQQHSRTSAGPWVASSYALFFQGRNPAAEPRAYRRPSCCRDSFPQIDPLPHATVHFTVSQHQLQFWLKADPQKTCLTHPSPSRGAR